MSCRIKLYEMSPTSPPSHRSVRSSTVLLMAVDQASLTNCCPVQTNRRLIGGGYGADLQFTPASFVYQVAIADTAHIYAGATVSNLNGATPGDPGANRRAPMTSICTASVIASSDPYLWRFSIC
jgi:hypothetical protein